MKKENTTWPLEPLKANGQGPKAKSQEPITHTQIINHFISKVREDIDEMGEVQPVRYLEIGVQDPEQNFNQINTSCKTGVDPEIWQSEEMQNQAQIFEANYHGAPYEFPKIELPHYDGRFLHGCSEYFWLQNKERFDVIFIDGLHHASAVFWDILNAVWVTDPGGYVLVHDLNPPDEKHQQLPREQKGWTGNAWLGWSIFLQFIGTIEAIRTWVLHEDYGVGVINVKSSLPQNMLPGFNEFDRDRSFHWGPNMALHEFRKLIL